MSACGLISHSLGSISSWYRVYTRYWISGSKCMCVGARHPVLSWFVFLCHTAGKQPERRETKFRQRFETVEQVVLLIVDFSLTYFTYCLDTFTVFFVTGRPLSCFLFQNEPKPSSVRWLVRCGAVHSGYCSFYTFWATGNTAACFQCFLCSVFVSQLQSRSTLMQEQWNTSLKVIPRQLQNFCPEFSWTKLMFKLLWHF